MTRDPRVSPAIGDALRCPTFGRCDVIDCGSGRVTVEWEDPTDPCPETFTIEVWRSFWLGDTSGEVLLVAGE